MLERASTCLDSAPRQLLRAPAHCLRSRRVLHSRCAPHGPGQLSLPVWWSTASVLTPASEPSASTSRPSRGPLLDFLYPEKTRALLRHLSGWRCNVPQTRRGKLLGAGVRPFSSAWGQAWQDEGSADGELVEQAKWEMGALLRNSSPRSGAEEPAATAAAWEARISLAAV